MKTNMISFLVVVCLLGSVSCEKEMQYSEPIDLTSIQSLEDFGSQFNQLTVLRSDLPIDYQYEMIVYENENSAYVYIEFDNVDEENDTSQMGLMTIHYVWNETRGTWEYEGEPEILGYQYYSYSDDDGYFAHGIFGDDEGLIPLDQDDEYMIYEDPTVSKSLSNPNHWKYLSSIFSKGYYFKISIRHKIKPRPNQPPVMQCGVNWSRIPHINVEIYKLRRGDGSLADTMNSRKPMYSIAKTVLDLANSEEIGHKVANWHIAAYRKDSRWCVGFYGSKMQVHKQGYLELYNNGACKEFCEPRFRDAFRQIPITFDMPFDMPIPYLDRVQNEAVNRMPGMDGDAEASPIDWWNNEECPLSDNLRQTAGAIGAAAVIWAAAKQVIDSDAIIQALFTARTAASSSFVVPVLYIPEINSVILSIFPNLDGLYNQANIPPTAR